MLASLTVGVPGGKKQWCWIPDGRPQDWKSRVAYRRQDYDDRVTGRGLGDTGWRTEDWIMLTGWQGEVWVTLGDVQKAGLWQGDREKAGLWWHRVTGQKAVLPWHRWRDRRLYYHYTGDGTEDCITMTQVTGQKAVLPWHRWRDRRLYYHDTGDGTEGCITMTLSLSVVREPAKTSKEPAVRNSEGRTKKQRVTIAYTQKHRSVFPLVVFIRVDVWHLRQITDLMLGVTDQDRLPDDCLLVVRTTQ